MIVATWLRGVNIGGHHKLKMEALRQLYSSLGFTAVRSYVQSGNLVFKTTLRSLPAIEKKIADAIEQHHAFRPDVMARTLDEMRAVYRFDPFAKREGLDPAKYVVMFLSAEPTPAAAEKALQIPIGPEVMLLHGRELYVYFPNGQGVSKFPAAAITKALGVSATARNWNSVREVLALMEALAT